ncbi:MAG: hypothetical protein OHK0046_19930 [Anaerolineae bacterium]
MRLIRSSINIIRAEGIGRFWRLLRGWLRGERGAYKPQLPPVTYDDFRCRTDPTPTSLTAPWQTTFAIVLYNSDGLDDQPTRQSLQAQIYPHWSMMEAGAALTADYVVLVNTGDTLAINALFKTAEAVHNFEQPALLYADCDRLNAAGERVDPFFKPDFSPEMMLSVNLLGDLLVVRRDLWVGEMESRWDHAFRLIESVPKGQRIHHIPHVLYHRRTAPENGQQAVAAHLLRTGIREAIITEDSYDLLRARWQLEPTRRVSIIIPSRDQPELVERCLSTLFEQTDYPDFQVILVDTGSVDPATYVLYEWFDRDPRFSLVHYEGVFNFSRACNLGAEVADGDLLLFLNNDTEILHADWLHRMAQWFARPGVGMVGAKLLYPDGRIQHAGVILGLHGLAAHIFALMSEHSQTIYGSESWYRNYVAVTGACMMVSRAVFDQVGGFEEAYQLNYSDVELCIRAVEAGYRVVYTPDARLKHHESATHQKQIPIADTALFNQRLQGYLRRGDPYFNSNLSYRAAVPAFQRDADDTPANNNAIMIAKLDERINAERGTHDLA